MWTSHRNFLQNHPTPPTPFHSCFWRCCPAGNSGERPGAPARLPLSRADGPPTVGGSPTARRPHPTREVGTELHAGQRTPPPPDVAVPGGRAWPGSSLPSQHRVRWGTRSPGMAFTSRGAAQRRKAAGPGGAWGRSRPREPLKAEFCTGWRLFSAAGSNIGDANCSQICFKQRDRTDLKAPWSPRQWVGGFSGEGSPGRALLHTGTSRLCSQAAAWPSGCLCSCQESRPPCTRAFRQQLDKQTGQRRDAISGCSGHREPEIRVPGNAAPETVSPGCRRHLPQRPHLGVGAMVPPLLRKPRSHHGPSQRP